MKYSLNTQTKISKTITTMKIKVKLLETTDQQKSAEIVASIPDLLTQILLRLPIKSLLRFKSVSKYWQSLITNPRFCLLRNPNPNPAIGLFLPVTNFRFEYVPFSSNKTKPPFEILEFTKDPSGFRVLQSCNGLFLLCYSSFQTRNYNKRYYVYNPTTKHFSTLPKLDERGCTLSRRHWVSLGFDPTKSPHYKVICVQEINSGSFENKYQILVYSSETGPWRVIDQPFTAPHVNFENGVYWNGAVHWVNNNGGGDSLYFNIEHQVLEKMPMPPIPEGWGWRSNDYFGESCDHLHFIEIFSPQVEFNVYEMKRDYSEWFVKYRVDLSMVVASYPEMIRANFDPTDWYYYAFSIFCLVRGEEEEDSFMVLQIPGKAIRYNLVSKTFEKLHEFDGAKVEDSLRFPSTKGFQYIESLCCV